MGLALPLFFVKEISGESYTKEDAKAGISKYMFVLALSNTFFGVLLLLVYKVRPSYYPSKIAKDMMTSKVEFNFRNDLSLLLRNKNYLVLMIPFVINYSVHHCLSAVLALLLGPYAYT